MTPLIAVPGRLSPKAEGLRTEAVALGQRYLRALRLAGAEGVVLLPDADALDALPDLLDRFDGLLLAGGGDVDPAAYGVNDAHEAVYGVNRDHDAFELAALEIALGLDLPVLAVCRGFQVLNVALGGTLHQHITDGETTVKHRGHCHAVAIEPGTRLAEAVGVDRPMGWSMHHQALDRLGQGLVVSARADDGTVEAVELPDRWVVGVQWHPEETALVDEDQQRLFVAFAGACRARADALRRQPSRRPVPG